MGRRSPELGAFFLPYLGCNITYPHAARCETKAGRTPMQQDSTPRPQSLPVILAAAVAQGWALYGLHHSITTHSWPATNLAWLFALYAVVVLIPVTIQLVADQTRSPSTWGIVCVLTVALFYFGWHHGG